MVEQPAQQELFVFDAAKLRNSEVVDCAVLRKNECAISKSPLVEKELRKGAQFLLPTMREIARPNSFSTSGRDLKAEIGKLQIEIDELKFVNAELGVSLISHQQEQAPYWDAKKSFENQLTALVLEEGAVLTPRQREILKQAYPTLDSIRASLVFHFREADRLKAIIRANKNRMKFLQFDVDQTRRRLNRKGATNHA
jgi:hypothetical protein